MQIKKILAIFLAAALIFAALVVPTTAETVDTFEVGVVAETTTPVSSTPVIYNSGEEVTVKISVDQNTGINYLRFVINFNADALEYKSHTLEKLLANGSVQVKDDYLIFFFSSDVASDAKGDLLTINFVTKDSYCGEVEISTALAQDRPANCKNGKENVPFVANKAAFNLHTINTAEGVITAPTCVDEGYTTYTCALCELAVVGNIVPANGHSPAEAVEENRIEADCVNDGSYDMAVYCSVCNVELSRESFVIPAKGHKPAEKVVENFVDSDCVNTGSYDDVVYCSVCNEELSRVNNIIDAKGHKPGDIVVENYVDSDCVNDGSYDNVVYCTVCNAELSRETIVIPAKGHVTTAVEENRVEPTCVNNGSYQIAVYCTVCEKELSRETFTIEALGHDLVNHEAKDATCTEIGWNAYNTCKRCDYTTYVEIKALGHKYGDVTVIEPEYKVEGYSTHTCTVCQHEEKFDITAALTYILGDVDGNEEITSDDAVALLYYTLLPEENPINQKGDFNGDGVVDSDDAIYLLYYTFVPELYPLSK